MNYQISELSSQMFGGAFDSHRRGALQRDTIGGSEASALNLKEEHLTEYSQKLDMVDLFRPASIGYKNASGWSVPADWVSPKSELTPVLKIQDFKSGGHEAVLKLVDLEQVGRSFDPDRPRGKREKPTEENRSSDSLLKAAARARRKIRHLTKNIGATNLVTLTRRETPEQVASGDYWSPEDWKKAWDSLRRALIRATGATFPYVAILEKHKKGNYHLHIAWVGKLNLNLVRPLWWSVCGGRGQGNVQSQYIKVAGHLANLRSDKIARYIAKYVSKAFAESSRFNEKRYWASRHDLPEVRRYILNSTDIDSAFKEVEAIFGYDLFNLYQTKQLYLFKGVNDSIEGGFINFLPDIHDIPVPF